MKTIFFSLCAAALVAVAVFAMGSSYARQGVRQSCDTYGAVKIGNDVYECKREVGVS